MINIIGIISLALNVALIAWILFKPELSKNKARAGVIKVQINDGTYNSSNYSLNYVNVVIVVKEIDRVADQSAISILSIDHSSHHTSRVEREVKRHLGQWWPTKDVLWDEEKTKEDDISKIIRTPMKELVKQIGLEDIDNM